MKAYLLFFLLTPAFANVGITLDREASSVEFLAVGKPSALKIRGAKGKPEGKILVKGPHVDGELIVDLAALETGIGLRDRHMKEKYLEVEKADFKTAKLKITSLGFPAEFWKAPSPQKTSFKGILRLHGVEKPVEGQLEISQATPNLQGMAQFSISLPDYAIAVPSFSGITVAEKVEVEVRFQGKLESL